MLAPEMLAYIYILQQLPKSLNSLLALFLYYHSYVPNI